VNPGAWKSRLVIEEEGLDDELAEVWVAQMRNCVD